MAKMNNVDGNYSFLIKSETDIFQQNIDILKSWRKTLWDSAFKGTSAFLISYLGSIYEMLEDLTNFRQYAPDEIYEEFVREYDMTMVLLQKCLIKSVNEALLPADENEQLKIKELISKIGVSQQNNRNMEAVISALRAEDPSTRKTLEKLGLPKDKIEKILTSGYSVKSVLDVEPISELKK